MNGITIYTDQGAIMAHLVDGTITLDTLTDVDKTRTLTPRSGREHLYKTEILASHTMDRSDWGRLAEWLTEAYKATRGNFSTTFRNEP